MEIDLKSLLQSLPDSPPVSSPLRKRGGSLPAVNFSRISHVPFYTMEGPDGLAQSRVQVDCYALSHPSAKTTAAAIIALVSGFSGIVGSTEFQLIQIDGERDIFDSERDAAENYFRVSLDLIIFHRSI